MEEDGLYGLGWDDCEADIREWCYVIPRPRLVAARVVEVLLYPVSRALSGETCTVADRPKLIRALAELSWRIRSWRG